MMRHTKQISAFVLLCIYTFAVGVLCLMEPEDIPSVSFDILGIPADKLVHFTMFFPFPVLAYFTLDTGKAGVVRKLGITAAIFAVGCIMAITTEFLQKLSGYRSFDMNDFYADVAGMGICCVFLVIGILHKHKRKCLKDC